MTFRIKVLIPYNSDPLGENRMLYLPTSSILPKFRPHQ